jgi:hypothetical protein
MATQTSGSPKIGPFYIKMTEGDPNNRLPGARDIFGYLSLTSQFKVSMHLTNVDTPGSELMSWLKNSGVINNPEVKGNRTNPFIYDFYCAEAVIPGISFDVTEEMGSRQGTIERFPTRRIFPEFTMTFYVDRDYNLIRLFEEWMNYINPLYGDIDTDAGLLPPDSRGQGGGPAKDKRNFFRFRYPDEYRRIISLTKFERDFDTRKKNNIKFPPHLTYRMLEAFPTNITAMPLTYEGSQIVKTTVTFQYTRYVMEKNYGTLEKGLYNS